MGVAIGIQAARDASQVRGDASAHFSPLGVTLCVKANSLALIRAVADTCRGWEAPAHPNGPVLELHVQTGLVPVGGEPRISTDGPLLAISGNVEAGADAERGEAWCRVASPLAFRDPGFREQVLDALILWLVTRRGRTPLHASAFMAGPQAILLAGRSGSGKSCLALAAHAAGYPLLSDDTVYVETQPRLRLWGIPRPVHVFPEDAPPGASGPIRLRAGKRKRAIALTGPQRPVTADAGLLLVLKRGGRLALDPLDPQQAAASLGALEPGFDLLATDIAAALQRLTPRGAWQLTLDADPDAAIRHIAANLPMLAERTAA